MNLHRRMRLVLGAACVLLMAGTLRAADQLNLWPDNSPELQGIAAYVVKYRLPVYGYKHPAPLHDAQRAVRIIRQNAEPWGLDGGKIGVIGGSSGGHVASTLATHFDRGDKSSKDPVERQSCRPDFVMLCDAVITMQGKDCHFYSRGRLLPENPPKALVDDLSNELQATSDTPPTFLSAGGQDRLVPAENSLMFFTALREHHVAFCELHFFSHGGTGQLHEPMIEHVSKDDPPIAMFYGDRPLAEVNRALSRNLTSKGP